MKIKNILFVFLILIVLSGCGTKSNELVGKWVADGTQKIAYTGNDEFSNPDPSPYYLEFFENGEFELTMDDIEVNGTYQINDDDSVYLSSDITCICNINDDELECNMYASKFVREK